MRTVRARSLAWACDYFGRRSGHGIGGEHHMRPLWRMGHPRISYKRLQTPATISKRPTIILGIMVDSTFWARMLPARGGKRVRAVHSNDIEHTAGAVLGACNHLFAWVDRH